ncbi:2Fe-2S iron-sulfur cluster-binding protein [Streptomyces paludis]|uniref:(2Fe-2S)-binding protein n=1 Tax=Streptomyces paludis TaxID=2282738 RepID=A0A345HN36_9ACTN|nr:2Fe-2S iron-sulfur cluster-binding protein [Streptomyces paludis]AXG78110.1 (2Fe-2S)-binding protein [Streptomyces paludis]
MTTNESSGTGTPVAPGGWQPVPQGGEYDGESTAFVQLPPEDSQDAPLAAPGHGYVPPSIGPPTHNDQAAPGGWAAQPVAGAGGTQWPEPARDGSGTGDGQAYGTSGYAHGGYGPGGYESQGTSHWNFSATVAEADLGAGPGQDGQGPSSSGTGGADGGGGAELTGQWTIPVARGELPEESGEFSTAALTSSAQWTGGSPPATLPGGAAAPWAADGDATASDAAVSDEGAPGADTDAGTGTEAATPADVPETPEPAPAPESAEPEPLTSSNGTAEHPGGSYVLRVNGADRPVTDAWIGESLLYVLRERLGLAGAKDGCSQGECGACNVQVDGRLVASCLVPAATAAGSEVRTVEGLAADGEPSDVQRALAKCGAVQCGFCIPGMAMTVHDLLEGNHAPSELETRQALCGNLCRCSGYRGVLDAVDEVVAGRKASAEAAAAASEEARVPHQASPGAQNGQQNNQQQNSQHQNGQNPHSPDGGMA